MKEELILSHTAKIAKEKGFDLEVKTYFTLGLLPPNVGLVISYDNKKLANFNEFNDTWSRPTQSLLQKWLRKKHNIEVIPCPHFKRKSYGCEIYHYTEKNETGYVPIELGSFNTYEEALEKGLQGALKLIRNK